MRHPSDRKGLPVQPVRRFVPVPEVCGASGTRQVPGTRPQTLDGITHHSTTLEAVRTEPADRR